VGTPRARLTLAAMAWMTAVRGIGGSPVPLVAIPGTMDNETYLVACIGAPR